MSGHGPGVMDAWWVSGMGPDLFELLRWRRVLGAVVETRRLELLTLSLQRRCSAS